MKLRHFNMAIFTSFEKSNQEELEFGDKKASTKVMSLGQQEEFFFTKLYEMNSIVQQK